MGKAQNISAVQPEDLSMIVRQKLVARDDDWFDRFFLKGDHALDVAVTHAVSTVSGKIEGKPYSLSAIFIPVIIWSKEHINFYKFSHQDVEGHVKRFFNEDSNVCLIEDIKSSRDLRAMGPLEIMDTLQTVTLGLLDGIPLRDILAFDPKNDVCPAMGGFLTHGALMAVVSTDGSGKSVGFHDSEVAMAGIRMAIHDGLVKANNSPEIAVIVGCPRSYQGLEETFMLTEACGYLTIHSHLNGMIGTTLRCTGWSTAYAKDYDLLVDGHYQASLSVPDNRKADFERLLTELADHGAHNIEVEMPTLH